MVFHHDRLPPPEVGNGVIAYTVRDNILKVKAMVAGVPLNLNLDTGVHECMTIPPALQGRIRWRAKPVEGPVLSYNQTGASRVRQTRAAGLLVTGPLDLAAPHVISTRMPNTLGLGVIA